MLLVKLVNGVSMPKVKCLSDICSRTFNDPPEINDLILLYKHMKKRHPNEWTTYTEDITKWVVNETTNVNSFFNT